MSSGRRRRPTPTAAIVAAIVVLVVLGAWWLLRDAGSDEPVSEAPPTGSGPADLVVVSVTGTPHAQLAVVGAGGSTEPAALVVPPATTIQAPGQGESTTEEVQALPGDAMRIAVSNAVGTWADGYGVVGLEALAAAVDRAGGLAVELPDPATLGADVVGPGAVTLSGEQVASYLAGPPEEATLRWMVVLEALLDTPVLEPSDFDEADHADGVIGVLAAAAGASANLMPTQVVGGTTQIPAQPALDDLMVELFATTPPTPVVVENGSGAAGIGEVVGGRIIPEGYRIVLSRNAESFRTEVTQITAVGDAHVEDAETIRDALGAGDVQVTQVPSGLADVVIVTGKDLQG